MLKIYLNDWTSLTQLPAELAGRLGYIFESYESRYPGYPSTNGCIGRVIQKSTGQSAQVKRRGNYVVANAETREHYIEEALYNLANVMGVNENDFEIDSAITNCIAVYLKMGQPSARFSSETKFQPYAKGTNMKENNPAAMLREDAYTLQVRFPDGDKAYTYVCNFADRPQAGDLLVVPTNGDHTFTLGTVAVVHDEVEIEPGDNKTYRWVAAKFDMAPYTKLLQENAEISKTLSDSYKRNAREAFRGLVLNGNPALAALLTHKGE